jgi:hypothetical protein
LCGLFPVFCSLRLVRHVPDFVVSNIHREKCVSVDWLDFSDEYDRLRREQRSLSRKEHGSENWEKQRREVAKVGTSQLA